SSHLLVTHHFTTLTIIHSFPTRRSSDLAIWWITLLPPDKRWDIATEYSQKSYMSHWSVQLSDTVRINLTEHSSLENLEPPSSDKIRRAHVRTPVTFRSRMPSSA